MKVNIQVPLKPEDEQALKNMGIVIDEKGARFEKKQLPPPKGYMRLSSGRLVLHQPIQECLAKC